MSDIQDHPTQPFDHKAFLSTVSRMPGVYRMIDGNGQVIYVGKAGNLRNRLASYFRSSGLSPKTRSMVRHIQRIEVIQTRTESEALILENDLIKNLNPRYNILFRDDKSYPYIQLTDHEFPRLKVYRGPTRGRKGQFFGPFPNAGAIRYTIHHLQRLFRLRDCEDASFRGRTRPCLQYQIKRCTAPCVGLVSAEDYGRQIEQAELFLKGRNEQLISDQVALMEAAAEALEFEKAAEIRDHIEQLRRVTEKQFVTGFNQDLDVVACVMEQDSCCIQVFIIRGGTSLGNKPFFIRSKLDDQPQSVLESFLIQHYSRHPAPREILLNLEPDNPEALQQALGAVTGQTVALHHRLRGKRRQAVAMAERNAREALQRHLQSAGNLGRRYRSLVECLELDQAPQRIECFDISHTQGEETRASCVVFGPEGAIKSDYRLYRIQGIQPGDDYGAMRQVLTRRYGKMIEQPDSLPSLVLIDGGKGQLHAALEVLDGLGVLNKRPDLRVLGVAKGPERRSGFEQIIDERDRVLPIPLDAPALLLIQQIRDEAHRFAITGHRKARGRARTHSTLEDIPGVGARRRQLLLQKFGGLQGVKKAGIEELMQIRGINRETAQAIYDTFHG